MVAKAIYDMAMEQPVMGREVVVWDASSEELRQEIGKRLRSKNGGKTPEDFPATSQKFGRKLSAISEKLSEVGIHIDRLRRDGSKRYTRITYTPDIELRPEPEAVSGSHPHPAANTESTASASGSENAKAVEKASVSEEAQEERCDSR